jgi:hypothetical protein
VRTPINTAAIAAGGLIAGYAVAVASGSRPLGGAVVAICGLTCVGIWLRRDGRRVAGRLTAIGFGAFIASHVAGLLVGAWPAVISAAAVTAGCCWWLSDRHHAADRLSRT